MVWWLRTVVVAADQRTAWLFCHTSIWGNTFSCAS
jgi:hypothetical protein